MFVELYRLSLLRHKCPGVTLVVYKGIIVKEMQCGHYHCNASGEVVSPSCARVHIMRPDSLADDLGVVMFRGPQYTALKMALDSAMAARRK